MRGGDTFWTLVGFLVLFALILAGCAGDNVTVPVAVCPEPVVYSAAEQAAAAAELKALREAGQAPTLRAWMVDYARERAALRACR